MTAQKESRPWRGAAPKSQGGDGTAHDTAALRSRPRRLRRLDPPPAPRVFDPGPPAAWPWLLDDRVAEHFAREVVHAELAPADKRQRALLYADRWGTSALTDALRHAARLAPLDQAMSELLRELTRAEVAI